MYSIAFSAMLPVNLANPIAGSALVLRSSSVIFEVNRLSIIDSGKISSLFKMSENLGLYILFGSLKMAGTELREGDGEIRFILWVSKCVGDPSN